VALTQITVETLLLVVFLIILGKVPAYYGTLSPTRISRDIFLSIFVGVMVFFTVIVSTISAPSKELSNFFINRASSPAIQSSNIIIDYGGGSNIVNVILVDFRALDTLGEISVVVLAALSILTILSSRQFRGQM
jgi:multicomponent Na+:H+ antiporter subunit A